MKSSIVRAAFISFVAFFAVPAARAASLQAAPVLVEMKETAPSSTITVRNTGTAPFDVQTRVFRWKQEGGKETMTETSEVVTSPPITTLQPGATYSVRVVRTSRQPLAREEAFRIFVDQLPDATTQRSGTVALVMRHSIPVFMLPNAGGAPKVTWSVSSRNGRLVLRAQNTGERRLRLAKVSVTLAGGKTVSFGNGLLGYALAGASMEWVSPGAIPAGALGAEAKVSAETDLGHLEAKAGATR